MIRITYSPEQTDLAQAIRDDLAEGYDAIHPLLIVLVSQQSSGDPLIQAEIETALNRRVQILPVLVDDVELPSALAVFPPLDFSTGYSRTRLMAHLSQVSKSGAEMRKANRRALLVIGGIAALMFALAIVAMIGGLVAFPVAEYNEEATFQAQWIDGLIRETLEYVQPRTTEDAQNFAATFEAAPTRLYYYVRGTATALARPQED